MKEIKNHEKKLFYWLILGTILIIIYKFLDNFTGITNAISGFFGIISPIIVGAIIAYFLYTPCKKVEMFLKRRKSKILREQSRTISIFIVYLIGIIILIMIGTYILPVIIESSMELVSNLEGYFEKAVSQYQSIPADSFIKSGVIDNAIEAIKGIDIKQYINLNNITEYAKGAISVVTGVINIFVAFIVSVYVLSERTKIYEFAKKTAKALLKDTKYNSLAKYFNSANKIFLGFISSQVIDGIVVGIITSIAMCIMGIKYAPLLGFIIGLFNIIPYVGAIIAVIIAAIITLITGGISQAIWMVIVVTILQQIDANIINPKIVGSSLKISPLLVMVAITIGGAYWGMFGIFIAVPISAIIKILAEDYIDYKTKLKQREKELKNKSISVIDG